MTHMINNTKKHTPGPWTYNPNNQDGMLPHDNVIVAADGTDIISPSEWVTIKDANAYLIAAAPELLAVVEAMANFDGRNNNAHLKEMALSAIAKATGETP